ncbi:MAG: sporulation transcriptional regulator SpoIIID [Bacilli bacterium]|nr:sporulation transcriptional regulator SpoIIID [Bacilli bacterium]
MNKIIETRIYAEVDYMVKTKCTVRELAKKFKISKSTVHKDLQERLESINKNVHKKINKIFKEHIEVRHLKGGESTRKRYLKLKEG